MADRNNDITRVGQRDFGTTCTNWGTTASYIRPGIYADVSGGAPLLPHFVYARSECSSAYAQARLSLCCCWYNKYLALLRK